MSRVMSSGIEYPASSACLGYMLVAVKPGSVFISEMYVSSVVTRKSIRASPEASTARYAASDSSFRRAARSPSTAARGMTSARPGTYFAS
jgi:hypothetical protein